jgi:hypothetical protein
MRSGDQSILIDKDCNTPSRGGHVKIEEEIHLAYLPMLYSEIMKTLQYTQDNKASFKGFAIAMGVFFLFLCSLVRPR